MLNLDREMMRGDFHPLEQVKAVRVEPMHAGIEGQEFTPFLSCMAH